MRQDRMGSILKILQTCISNLTVVETISHTDARGAFARLFCVQELSAVIGNRNIIQINHSRTKKVGALRGLHFQNSPHAEMKLVHCIKGRVWDVAADLRANSPTFLKWHAEELSPTNARVMIIPEGFAHGFQVLEPESELLYLHTALYEPSSEGGIRFDDPMLNITWPLEATDLSKRDTNHSLIDSNFQGLKI
jgi:dTDP-4-dehydrorhamnose 3,5-epimerase